MSQLLDFLARIERNKKFELLAVLALGLFLIFYISPLFSYESVLAGKGGDTLAHTADLQWFCDNFYMGEYTTTDLFYPNGVDLSGSYDMPFLQTLVCPFVATSPILGFNLIAIIQVVLIFGLSILVAKNYLKNNWLRVCFVMLYGFNVYTLTKMDLQQNNLSSVWTVALIFLLFDRWIYSSLGKVIGGFFMLGLAYSSGWQNIATLTFLVAFLIGRHLYSLWRNKKLISGVLIKLILGGMVCGIITYYFAQPQITAQSTAVLDFDPGIRAHADILSYVLPHKNSFFGKILPETIQQNHFYEQHIGIDWIVLILLFFIFLWRKGAKKDAYLLTIAFLYVMLSFGDEISFLHQKIFNLPYYDWLKQVPPMLFTRRPARLGVVVIFTITLYVLRQLDALLRSIKHERKTGRVVPLLAIYSIWSTTIGASNLQHVSLSYYDAIPVRGMRIIADDMRDGAVLNIPTTIRTDHLASFLQLFHGKPIFTGFVSYRILNQQGTKLLESDTILRSLDCGADAIYPGMSKDLSEAEIMKENELFVDHLRSLNVSYLIMDVYSLNSDSCKDLGLFINHVQTMEGISFVDYQGYLLVLKVDPHEG